MHWDLALICAVNGFDYYRYLRVGQYCNPSVVLVANYKQKHSTNFTCGLCEPFLLSCIVGFIIHSVNRAVLFISLIVITISIINSLVFIIINNSFSTQLTKDDPWLLFQTLVWWLRKHEGIKVQLRSLAQVCVNQTITNLVLKSHSLSNSLTRFDHRKR